MNNFIVNCGQLSFLWDSQTVENKLQNLSQLKNKNKGWICSDLNIAPSTITGRFLWSTFCKHFDGLRERYYGG